jgi:pimeloyl-ACP methyl ester carboxylesterase
MGTTHGPERFAERRLALFEQHGFPATGATVADRHGRPTHVLTRGSGPRPTVLVHGGLSDASEWCLFAGRLGGHVVIPDRPGCGLSYPIDYTGVDFRAAAAEWMRDLVDGLGADQVDLVGNSMGGYFSIVFALAHPERVHRLVLVGAPAGVARRLPLFIRLWGNPLVGRRVGSMRIPDAETFRRRVAGPLLVARPDELPVEFLEIALEAGALPGADVAAHTMLRQVTTSRGWRRRLRIDRAMAGLEVPTLLLWGDRDAFTRPTPATTAFVDRIPGAHLEVLEDCGHVAQLDRPADLAASVTAWRSGGHTLVP